jgi:hypothetical protein
LYADAEACAGVLQGLRDSGHTGAVVIEGGRPWAVLTGIVRDDAVLGSHLRLPADGFAVDPGLRDPTRVLALLYGEFARPFVAAGARLHLLEHVALPPLHEGLSNLRVPPRQCLRRSGSRAPALAGTPAPKLTSIP